MSVPWDNMSWVLHLKDFTFGFLAQMVTEMHNV